MNANEKNIRWLPNGGYNEEYYKKSLEPVTSKEARKLLASRKLLNATISATSKDTIKQNSFNREVTTASVIINEKEPVLTDYSNQGSNTALNNNNHQMYKMRFEVAMKTLEEVKANFITYQKESQEQITNLNNELLMLKKNQDNKVTFTNRIIELKYHFKELRSTLRPYYRKHEKLPELTDGETLSNMDLCEGSGDEFDDDVNEMINN